MPKRLWTPSLTDFFFIAVIFMSIPGLLSLLFIPLDESHQKIKVEVD